MELGRLNDGARMRLVLGCIGRKSLYPQKIGVIRRTLHSKDHPHVVVGISEWLIRNALLPFVREIKGARDYMVFCNGNLTATLMITALI